MIVSTGTCALPLPIEQGNKITADFGTLGLIDINIE
jgi:2-keto-4-pentenoate hydratase